VDVKETLNELLRGRIAALRVAPARQFLLGFPGFNAVSQDDGR